jgi:hypothetical protein
MARLIFMRLIEVVDEGEDGRPIFYTRRRAKLTELALRPEEQKLVHDILTRLADSRLLTIGQDSVEVAHEALIHEWPRLLNWLNENRDALRLHRRVTASPRNGNDRPMMKACYTAAASWPWLAIGRRPIPMNSMTWNGALLKPAGRLKRTGSDDNWKMPGTWP